MGIDWKEIFVFHSGGSVTSRFYRPLEPAKPGKITVQISVPKPLTDDDFSEIEKRVAATLGLPGNKVRAERGPTIATMKDRSDDE